MSGREDAEAQLKRLASERATGCLSITSADGRIARVYLLMGRPFHAVGPTGEGQVALNDALSWSGAGMAFDPKAALPSTVTIAPTKSPLWIGIRRQQRGVGESEIPSLTSDPRLTAMGCAAVGGGCLAVLVPAALLGIGAVVDAHGMNADGFANAAVITLPVLLVLSLVAYQWFRVQFFREAVTVPGAPDAAQIPRIVAAEAGVITGQPEFTARLRTRSTAGKLGKCWIELYPEGLQVCKGPDRPEPRWQFSYQDIVQAELADLVYNGRMTTNRYFVRLVMSRPRMAFLFGGSLFQNSSAQMLATKLREHKVPLLNESFDF